MSSRGRLLILSAPAGTGKNTLVTRLCDEFSDLVESTSCTTRKPRPGEVQGEHYDFTSEEQFRRKIEEGAFLEHVELFGHLYGTLKTSVEEQLKRGLSVILVIDTQGALELKGKINASFIFLAPPSLEELKARLVSRKTESAEGIAVRLARAEREMELAQEYDYCIVNDEVERAYDVLRAIFIAEKHRRRS